MTDKEKVPGIGLCDCDERIPPHPKGMCKKAKFQARYQRAAHAIQSGVAFRKDKKDQLPKHLRVGVNLAMCDHGSLVQLLLKKGVFTEDEYSEAIVEGMELEVERYRETLKREYGADCDITLA